MNAQDIGALIKERILCEQLAQLISTRTIRYPASLVHRLEFSVDGYPRVLFVKQPRESGPKYEILASRLRREFEISMLVKQAFPETTELRVVTPAGFLNEVNGLVTWEVAGPSLQDVLASDLRLRYSTLPSKLAHLCESAGHWLRQFHALHLIADAEDPRESVIRHCSDRLHTLISSRGSGVTGAIAESVSGQVRVWVDAAYAEPATKVILCHNDFSPHNIIVTVDGICVLDFSFAEPGFPSFDVACFWYKLEDLKFSLLHSSRLIESLQTRFIDAYGAPFDPMGPSGRLGLVRLVLSKMVTLLKDKPTRLDKWIDKHRRYSRYLTLLNTGFEP